MLIPCCDIVVPFSGLPHRVITDFASYARPSAQSWQTKSSFRNSAQFAQYESCSMIKPSLDQPGPYSVLRNTHTGLSCRSVHRAQGWRDQFDVGFTSAATPVAPALMSSETPVHCGFTIGRCLLWITSCIECLSAGFTAAAHLSLSRQGPTVSAVVSVYATHLALVHGSANAVR